MATTKQRSSTKRLAFSPTSTEIIRPVGCVANVGVQNFWIDNIAIMTRLLNSTTTPPPHAGRQRRLTVDNLANYHLNLNDNQPPDKG